MSDDKEETVPTTEEQTAPTEQKKKKKKRSKKKAKKTSSATGGADKTEAEEDGVLDAEDQIDSSNTGGPPLSLFSVIRSVASQLTIGVDITRVSLPSAVCYPFSLLEIMASKRLRGADQLPIIAAEKDALGRALLATKWFFSSLTADEFGKKPLNPTIGETFEASADGCSYVSEQVSHHPPISAFHFQHTGCDASFNGNVRVEAKFGGNSVAANFVGEAFLEIAGEEYVYSIPMPTIHACGLLMGKSRNELGGKMEMVCEKTGWTVSWSFKTSGMFTGGYDEVEGEVKHSDAKKPAITFSGHWNRTLKVTVKDKQYEGVVNRLFPDGVLYNHEEIKKVRMRVKVTEGTRDSRTVWGKVAQAIKEQDLDRADTEKSAVEQAQREMLAKVNEEGGFKPKWFTFDETTNRWNLSRK